MATFSYNAVAQLATGLTQYRFKFGGKLASWIVHTRIGSQGSPIMCKPSACGLRPKVYINK